MSNRKKLLPDDDGESERSSSRLQSRRRILQTTGALLASSALVPSAVSAAANYDHKLEILTSGEPTETGQLGVEYQFTATGEIAPVIDGSGPKSEGNDGVTENSDSTWTATGRTGNGFDDAYTFNGDVTDFSASGSYELLLDGSTVTVEELTTNDTVEFSLASLTTNFTNYAVQVAADKPPVSVMDDTDVENRLEAEGDDTVSQLDDGTYLIEGRTGTADGTPPAYGDTFRWTSTESNWGIVDFTFTDATASDLTITINGETVAPSDLPTSTTEQSGPNIGGGDGYSNTVPESEATVVVSNQNELLNAISSASSGDVIYVAGGTEIDAGYGDFHVPDGVTLASDRGIDGASGGKILFTKRLWPQATLGNNVRVTGLQVYGIDLEYQALTRPRNVGMKTTGSGVEIDNCEFAGFRGAAISADADTQVHHCSIHDNPMDGLGYGVQCVGGNPTVEYCYLNRNRHSVMSTGSSGYTFRNNIVGDTSWGIPIDIHTPGNGEYEIHNNTVRATTWQSNHASRDYSGDESQPAVQIRGDSVSCSLYDNWFYNPNEPSDTASGYGSDAIVKADPAEWGPVTYEGNQYGETEPSNSVGHPR